MKIATKVLVFSIVSLATWMLTSSIVAQQQRKPKPATSSKLEATVMSMETDKPKAVASSKPEAMGNFMMSNRA